MLPMPDDETSFKPARKTMTLMSSGGSSGVSSSVLEETKRYSYKRTSVLTYRRAGSKAYRADMPIDAPKHPG